MAWTQGWGQWRWQDDWWQGTRWQDNTGAASSGVGGSAPHRVRLLPNPATKREASGWSVSEGGWKHNPLPNTKIIQMLGAPDLVDMIAARDNISREEAKPIFQEWKNTLIAATEVKLTIRARASTGGHAQFKKGQRMRKLTLYGSEGVHAAFDRILDLLDDGGFDTSQMDLPHTYMQPERLVLTEARIIAE